jgi:hypothetical protein
MQPRYDAKMDAVSAAEDTAETNQTYLDSDDNGDDDISFVDSAENEGPQSPRTKTLSPLPLTNDARAAYMLMKLHMQDVMVDDELKRKKRRAST